MIKSSQLCCLQPLLKVLLQTNQCEHHRTYLPAAWPCSEGAVYLNRWQLSDNKGRCKSPCLCVVYLFLYRDLKKCVLLLLRHLFVFLFCRGVKSTWKPYLSKSTDTLTNWLQAPQETGSDIKVQDKAQKSQQKQERADLWGEQSHLFSKNQNKTEHLKTATNKKQYPSEGLLSVTDK